MSTLNLFYKLKEAYELSTHSNNRFFAVLEAIKWDHTFYADGEHYFVKGNMTFTTTSLNPFDVAYPPEAIFSDGSYLSF